jgi:hypothetical protein
MGSEDVDRFMDEIAARALERLDDLILVMERAADQVASGGALEEIEVSDYQLYMAEGSERAIVCVLGAEEYFDLLDAVASEAGVCLEDSEELIVHAPNQSSRRAWSQAGSWPGRVSP